MNLKTTILEWIEENKDKLVTLTQELVKIPSIIGHEKPIQLFLQKRLSELAMESELVYPDIEKLRMHNDFFETTSFEKYGYKDRPNVFATLKGEGNGHSICLSGHVDVVSPEPVDDWTNNINVPT